MLKSTIGICPTAWVMNGEYDKKLIIDGVTGEIYVIERSTAGYLALSSNVFSKDKY